MHKLTSAHGGAYELGMHERDDGVPIAPFADREGGAAGPARVHRPGRNRLASASAALADSEGET